MNPLKSLVMISALLVGGGGPFCATANELPDGNINDRPPVAAAPDKGDTYLGSNCSSSPDTTSQNVHDDGKSRP